MVKGIYLIDRRLRTKHPIPVKMAFRLERMVATVVARGYEFHVESGELGRIVTLYCPETDQDVQMERIPDNSAFRRVFIGLLKDAHQSVTA